MSDWAKSWLAFRHYVEAYSLTLRTDQEKRDYLAYWQKTTGYRIFVETGTCEGRTTRQMAQLFAHCFTVELDPTLQARALDNFAGLQNITAILGDSAAVLPTFLAQVKEPAVFWLDAHDSGGVTARGTEDTPIARELALVFAHPVQNHLILIDDARTFCGVFGYPSIRKLERFVREKSPYYLHINNDIIVIYPPGF
jgi:hypothetical protein